MRQESMNTLLGGNINGSNVLVQNEYNLNIMPFCFRHRRMDYISQTPVEIYENTTGIVLRSALFTLLEGLPSKTRG